MERRTMYTTDKDTFGKKREESGDEGSPKISSHETTVAFPNKKNLKTGPLEACWSKSRQICLNKMNE